MTALTHTIELTLDYDQDCENPLTSCDGMWTLYEGRDVEQFFSSRGGRLIPDTLDLFFKLRSGLAWIVGGSRDNYGYCGYYAAEYDPDDRIRGLLVWEHPAADMGAKTKEERRRDADSTLDEFNAWAGGDCYGFAVRGLDFAYDDSCRGFIGAETLMEAVQEFLPDERPLTIVYADDDRTDGIAWSDSKWGEGIEAMTMKEYRARCREEDAAEGDELGDSEALDREAA